MVLFGAGVLAGLVMATVFFIIVGSQVNLLW